MKSMIMAMWALMVAMPGLETAPDFDTVDHVDGIPVGVARVEVALAMFKLKSAWRQQVRELCGW